MSEEVEEILRELEELASKVRKERSKPVEETTTRGAATPPEMIPEEIEKELERAEKGTEIRRLIESIIHIEGEEEETPTGTKPAKSQKPTKTKKEEKAPTRPQPSPPKVSKEEARKALRELLSRLGAAKEKPEQEKEYEERAEKLLEAVKKAPEELARATGVSPELARKAGEIAKAKQLQQLAQQVKTQPQQIQPQQPQQTQMQAGATKPSTPTGSATQSQAPQPKQLSLQEAIKKAQEMVKKGATPPQQLPEQVPGMAHFYEILVLSPSRDMFRVVTKYSMRKEERTAISKLAAEAAAIAEKTRRKINLALHRHHFINIMPGRWVTIYKEDALDALGEIKTIIHDFFNNPIVRQALVEKGYNDYTIAKLEKLYTPRIIDTYIPVYQAIQLLEQARTRAEAELHELKQQLREITEKRKRAEKERTIREKEKIIDLITSMINKLEKTSKAPQYQLATT